MKKFLSQIILLVAAILLVIPGNSKTIKIGCVDDYFPYINMKENGELEGIIIDLWTLWSEKTGVEIEFVPLNIQECINQTQSGEIDIIAAIFFSEERAQYLDFSEPLMRMQTALFVNKQIVVDSLQNFNGVVSLVENSLAHSFLLENYPELKLNVVESNTSLLKSIYTKKIDGFVYDIPNLVGNYKSPKAPNGYYRLETIFAERLRPAIKRGNSELQSLIIMGLGKITVEELVQIIENWDYIKKDRTQLWWFLGAGFILILIILILLYYYYQNKQKAKISSLASKMDWQVIIDKGENDLIEFKSSLRWDYHQEKVNKALELVVVKTISAFLNTEGGMLFIGVNDDGNALGLDNDYQCLSKKNRDGFLLTLTNLINQNLGKSTHKFVTINIISINDKDVCIVSAEKSDKPVFFGKNEKEEFYIRASASSQPLGMRESYKYITSHWEK